MLAGGLVLYYYGYLRLGKCNLGQRHTAYCFHNACQILEQVSGQPELAFL